MHPALLAGAAGLGEALSSLVDAIQSAREARGAATKQASVSTVTFDSPSDTMRVPSTSSGAEGGDDDVAATAEWDAAAPRTPLAHHLAVVRALFRHQAPA